MWQRITACSELPAQGGREFVVGDRVLALFQSNGAIVALDGICPHAGGPLAEGTVSAGVVTCPWHGWQFHIENGQHCLSSQIRQTCFPVKIEDGQVYVELP